MWALISNSLISAIVRAACLVVAVGHDAATQPIEAAHHKELATAIHGNRELRNAWVGHACCWCYTFRPAFPLDEHVMPDIETDLFKPAIVLRALALPWGDGNGCTCMVGQRCDRSMPK